MNEETFNDKAFGKFTIKELEKIQREIIDEFSFSIDSAIFSQVLPNHEHRTTMETGLFRPSVPVIQSEFVPDDAVFVFQGRMLMHPTVANSALYSGFADVGQLPSQTQDGCVTVLRSDFVWPYFVTVVVFEVVMILALIGGFLCN